MLRRLFACLALLTGLASGAPAQAHLVAVDVARIEARPCEDAGTRTEAVLAAGVDHAHTHVVAEAVRLLALGQSDPVLTVRTGIDRARE